jgi:hypothetical protein
LDCNASAIRKPSSRMVDSGQIPPGETQQRQVGLFHPIWLAGILLICSLLAAQPVSLGKAGIPAVPENIYWLYRREAGSSYTPGPTVDILVVGDVMLGRGVTRIADPFGRTRQLLASTDLTVGNFEGVISSLESEADIQEDGSGSMPYRLVAPERAVLELEEAGFDLLSLANNHSLDLAQPGLLDTIDRLSRSGIKVVGVGNNFEAAYRPVIVDVKGVRIGFLAIDAIPEPISAGLTGPELQRATWNKDRVLTAIHQLHPVSDVIVVLVHWGDEYEIRAGPNQRQAAQEMVGAGADAVIGSHPHVVQETQILEDSSRRKDGFVAFSLGNFVFDQFEENSRIGLALKLVVDAAGLKSVEAIPLHAGPEPGLLSAAESQKLVERIRPEPNWLGFRCNQAGCLPDQKPLWGRSGLFASGQIDLTGDGVLETVRLENGRVFVFEGARLGWESPPEWRVLDMALGDPNDDGRGELMLALLKPGKDGKIACHPFMIGHRGGIYRQVWGGSAVAIPIQEIELADVDGDGRQEMIVLEEQKDGMKTFAVLKWDDWVFRLFWRSLPGRYMDLQVREAGDSQPEIVIGERR